MLAQIESLTPRHFKILDYAIEGRTSQDIAKTLGMHFTQVSKIMNSSCFVHQLAIRRKSYEQMHDTKLVDEEDEVMKSLKHAARDAASKIVNKMESEDEKISLRAAESVLDRAGYSKIIKDERKGNTNIGPVIILTDKDVTRIVDTIEIENTVGEHNGTSRAHEGSEEKNHVEEKEDDEQEEKVISRPAEHEQAETNKSSQRLGADELVPSQSQPVLSYLNDKTQLPRDGEKSPPACN